MQSNKDKSSGGLIVENEIIDLVGESADDERILLRSETIDLVSDSADDDDLNDLEQVINVDVDSECEQMLAELEGIRMNRSIANRVNFDAGSVDESVYSTPVESAAEESATTSLNVADEIDDTASIHSFPSDRPDEVDDSKKNLFVVDEEIGAEMLNENSEATTGEKAAANVEVEHEKRVHSILAQMKYLKETDWLMKPFHTYVSVYGSIPTHSVLKSPNPSGSKDGLSDDYRLHGLSDAFFVPHYTSEAMMMNAFRPHDPEHLRRTLVSDNMTTLRNDSPSYSSLIAGGDVGIGRSSPLYDYDDDVENIGNVASIIDTVGNIANNESEVHSNSVTSNDSGALLL